jgi:hypothetical protein
MRECRALWKNSSRMRANCAVAGSPLRSGGTSPTYGEDDRQYERAESDEVGDLGCKVYKRVFIFS